MPLPFWSRDVSLTFMKDVHQKMSVEMEKKKKKTTQQDKKAKKKKVSHFLQNSFINIYFSSTPKCNLSKKNAHNVSKKMR